MIRIKNTTITSVAFGSVAITAIRKGAQLIWQAVRSCFGRGYWIDDQPWNDDDVWKD